MSLTDQLGRKTAYTYDAMGNVIATVKLAGTAQAVTVNRTYEPLYNQIASLTDPLNHTVTLGYDSRGSVTSITDPLGNQTAMAYNFAGRPISLTDPLSQDPQSSALHGTTTVLRINCRKSKFNSTCCT